MPDSVLQDLNEEIRGTTFDSVGLCLLIGVFLSFAVAMIWRGLLGSQDGFKTAQGFAAMIFDGIPIILLGRTRTYLRSLRSFRRDYEDALEAKNNQKLQKLRNDRENLRNIVLKTQIWSKT